MRKEFELLVLTIGSIDMDSLSMDDNITLLDNYRELYVNLKNKYTNEAEYELLKSHLHELIRMRDKMIKEYEYYIVNLNIKASKKALTLTSRIINVITALDFIVKPKFEFNTDGIAITGGYVEKKNTASEFADELINHIRNIEGKKITW